MVRTRKSRAGENAHNFRTDWRQRLQRAGEYQVHGAVIHVNVRSGFLFLRCGVLGGRLCMAAETIFLTENVRLSRHHRFCLINNTVWGAQVVREAHQLYCVVVLFFLFVNVSEVSMQRAIKSSKSPDGCRLLWLPFNSWTKAIAFNALLV